MADKKKDELVRLLEERAFKPILKALRTWLPGGPHKLLQSRRSKGADQEWIPVFQ